MGELPSKSVSTGGLGERETLPTPSSPVEGGRAGSEVIRTGEPGVLGGAVELA